MNGQLQTIELYMIIVGVSLMIGLMFSAYSSSVSGLRQAGEKRVEEINLMDFCSSFADETIPEVNKKLGELLSIYNLTGKDVFVFRDKYSLNLTKKINNTLEMTFGKRWQFVFGRMRLGYDPKGKTLGCRIYVPSLKNRGYTYAVLRVW